MKYLSLFSGIEAASVAWGPLGWQAVAFSEIEPFPCSLLEYRFPNVPNLGDVTRITENRIKKLGEIDLVVFGSPCQDLSIAGKRKGLDGARSGLFKSAIRIVRWARKYNGLRFALWENVPGAFSSQSGRDFAVVVSEMAGTEFGVPRGGWKNTGVAVGPNGLVEWGVLDAQFFGVPQRRRRVFALADFGDWASREPILFESGSLRRDSEASGKKRETTAARTGGGTAFDFQAIGQYGSGKVGSTLCAIDFKDLVVSVTEPITHALTYRHDSGEDGTGRGTPIIHTATPTQVRRLTPTECSRLQGFSDDWTDIPHRGKPAADAPRYKALGNSMAVPVIRWIGERIDSVEMRVE